MTQSFQPNAPSPSPKDDPVWDRLGREAEETAKAEPLLAGYLHDNILRHPSLESAISYFLANKFASHYLGEVSLRDVFYEV